MLEAFCRNQKCGVRKILDGAKSVDYITDERKKELFEGATCVNCMAWKFQRFIEENPDDERCVGRS